MFDNLRDQLRRLVTDSEGPLPNKFTIGMGLLIRRAREEAGMSQAQLANLIIRRQATISDIENGKMEASALTLVLLAHTLKKPLAYFYPKGFDIESQYEKQEPEELELLMLARKLEAEDLQKVIAQVRALVQMQEREIVEAMREEHKEFKETLKSRKKKG